jgi:hypothetical protein
MRGIVGGLDLDAADQYPDSPILEEHEIFWGGTDYEYSLHGWRLFFTAEEVFPCESSLQDADKMQIQFLTIFREPLTRRFRLG